MIHLLSRATYGVRPQDVEDVMRIGRRAWLDRQLQPASIADTALDVRLARVAQVPQQAGAGAVFRLVSGGTSPGTPAAVSVRAGAPATPSAPPSPAMRDTVAEMRRALQGIVQAHQALTSAQQQILNSQQRLLELQRQLASGSQQPATAQRQLADAQQQIVRAQQELTSAQRQLTSAQEQLLAARRPVPAAAARQPLPTPQARPAAVEAVEAARTPTAASAPPSLPPGTLLDPVTRFTTQSAAQVLNSMVSSKLARAVYSERQLEAVMTDFWFNHFNVLYNKPGIHTVLADYEDSAIRRHVFGRFEDMLLATAKHPAMLVYLDNYLSSAPLPPATPGSSPARPAVRPGTRGLNENYARELMELHTLGVDGGYTQQDVIEVARAFTGWGVVSRTAAGGPGTVVVGGVSSLGGFAFSPDRHDSGEKVVLGRRFPAGGGMDEGVEILRMLARHPSTAQNVATKLARHFVADDPPPRLVAELARVFRQTDGDLRQVTRALFLSDAFNDRAYYRGKVKRPFEFVASAVRVTGAEVAPMANGVVPQLRDFKHLPYGEAVPTGYATTADEWVSAGALLGRMNFALALVGNRVQGLSLPSPARPAAAVDPQAVAADVLGRTLFGVSAMSLHSVIAEDLRRQPQTPRLTPAARATALALGSPEFQRH